MKNKSSLITLITTVIILIVGYFAYTSYIGPMYRNNKSQTFTVDLGNTTQIAIGKHQQQKDIFGLELEIKGQSRSIIGINLSDSDNLVYNARIKGGEIDFSFTNNWYKDTLYLNFDTDIKENGHLEIDVRFLGTY